MLLGSDKIGSKDFQCNVTMQGILKGQIDFGHSANAKAVQDAIAADRLVCKILAFVGPIHVLCQ
jgi:hypothetical protein